LSALIQLFACPRASSRTAPRVAALRKLEQGLHGIGRLALTGNGTAAGERAVDVQVNRLRRKIEQDPARPQIVQTVLGGGYRLGLTRDD